MSNTRGRTQGAPDATGSQMPTSIPPVAALARLELSSWYWKRAPAGGSQLCVVAGACPGAGSAIVASNAAAGSGARCLLALTLTLARADDEPDDVALVLRGLLEAVELHLEEGGLVRHAERGVTCALHVLGRGLERDRNRLPLRRAGDTDQLGFALHV